MKVEDENAAHQEPYRRLPDQFLPVSLDTQMEEKNCFIKLNAGMKLEDKNAEHYAKYLMCVPGNAQFYF